MFLTMILSTLLAGCSETADDESPLESKVRESEVFIYSGGKSLKASKRRVNPKDEIGYSIPDNGRYLVYYYIRIDGNIPGEDAVNLPAKEFFPRTKANKTMICDLNHGYVQANVDWRSCNKFNMYVYSKDGSAVQSIIVEEPTLEDLINADQGVVTKDGQTVKDDFSGYLAHKDELHFIWYACKKQETDHLWHIDGILTTKDRTNITDTDYGEEIVKKNEDEFGMVNDEGDVTRNAHIEVDVHQQEHADWNEIKTSIHMRDTVDVEVFLPIDYQQLSDDFDIRAGVDYAYITELKDAQIQIGDATYEMQVSITHEAAGTRIIVHPNKEALRAAREIYQDGITFEIHSYVTPGIPTAIIWEKLKGTTCTVSPYTTLRGQVTSAYNDERISLDNEKPADK